MSSNIYILNTSKLCTYAGELMVVACSKYWFFSLFPTHSLWRKTDKYGLLVTKLFILSTKVFCTGPKVQHTQEGARGSETVFILTEHSEYDVATDGGQKANKYQERSLTPQTLDALLQSLGAWLDTKQSTACKLSIHHFNSSGVAARADFKGNCGAEPFDQSLASLYFQIPKDSKPVDTLCLMLSHMYTNTKIQSFRYWKLCINFILRDYSHGHKFWQGALTPQFLWWWLSALQRASGFVLAADIKHTAEDTKKTDQHSPWNVWNVFDCFFARS